MLSFEKQIDAKGSTNGSIDKLTVSHSEQGMQPGVEKNKARLFAHASNAHAQNGGEAVASDESSKKTAVFPELQSHSALDWLPCKLNRP